MTARRVVPAALFLAVLAGLTLVAGVSLAAGKAPLPYQDPQLPVEVRVNDLLSRMTLAEKLNQVRSDSNDPVWKTAAATTGFGEVYDILRPLEPREAAKLANETQRLARQSRLGIPIIIRDESLHGLAGPRCWNCVRSSRPKRVSARCSCRPPRSASTSSRPTIARASTRCSTRSPRVPRPREPCSQ